MKLYNCGGSILFSITTLEDVFCLTKYLDIYRTIYYKSSLGDLQNIDESILLL